MRPPVVNPPSASCVVSKFSCRCYPRFVHGRNPCVMEPVGKGWITPTPHSSVELSVCTVLKRLVSLRAGTETVPRPPSIRAGSRPVTSSCMRPLAPVTPVTSTPPLRNRSVHGPGRATGVLTAGDCSNLFHLHVLNAGPQPSFNRAPSGTTPASMNRHRSINRRRASATMPMRRWRLPPPPKRSWNQRLCLLPGW